MADDISYHSGASTGWSDPMELVSSFHSRLAFRLRNASFRFGHVGQKYSTFSSCEFANCGIDGPPVGLGNYIDTFTIFMGSCTLFTVGIPL